MTRQHTGPNVFLVKTPKAGTTSLYLHLRTHRDVLMASLQEFHFFSKFGPPLACRDLYRVVTGKADHFDLFLGAENHKAAYDASPSCLVSDVAACRIRNEIPHVRIIVLCREPIEPAFSHYPMSVLESVESKLSLEGIRKDHAAPKKSWGFSQLYVKEWLYYESLKRYIDVVGMENVLFLGSEKVASSPRRIVRYCLRFLDLEFSSIEMLRCEHWNGFKVTQN
jgi:Sulfotransferase domain